MANYPTSAPSFTTKNTGDIIQPAHVNDIQDEVVAIGTVLVNSLNVAANVITSVKFPATQVASADANTLDDYEEGTWTPTFSGTAGNGVFTTKYIKVGAEVKFWMLFTWGTTTSCGAATVQTFTLPFTSAASGFAVGSVILGDLGTGQYTAVAYLTSTTAVSLYNCDGFQAAAVVGNTPFVWTTGDAVTIHGTFYV